MGEYLDAYGDASSYITYMAARLDSFWTIRLDLSTAISSIGDENDTFFKVGQSIDAIKDGLVAARTMMGLMLGAGYGYVNYEAILDGFGVAAESPAADWKAIVTAMYEASDSGKLWWIMGIDRMRLDVWNEPLTILEIDPPWS